MTGTQQNRPFFFIQMSDIQFGMITANEDFSQETELFEKAIVQINRLTPTFVLNTGDLINEPGDERQMDEALRILDKIDACIPVYSVPGNHDIADAPREENLSWYRSRLERDWYSFDVIGWHFIGLNSCIIQQGDDVACERERQFEWLESDLGRMESADNERIIVFMHHPLCLRDPQEEDDYFNIPLPSRRKYLDLFKHYGVRSVFSGHLHRNSLAVDCSLELVTTGPVGLPLGDDPSGFRIIKVFSDRIEHYYYGLDDVPARAEIY